MREFYAKVSNALEKVVNDNYGLKLDYPILELPQKPEFGDLSSMVALKLASKLKKNPLELAGDIKTHLEKLLPEVEKINILKPGFINIFISKDKLIYFLNKIIKTREGFFRSQEKKKILVEFLSANPTGPLSIAHGRQAVVGDVIVRMLEFLGNKVLREYYLNNAGRQIDLLASSTASAISMQDASVDLKGIDLEGFDPDSGYKGDYIKEIANDYISSGSKEDIADYSMKHQLNEIKKDLKDLDINFNNWFSQKKLIDDGKIKEIVSVLENKELLYEKEGALWFAATKFGDDKDRVIKKADGELTYFASDIAYHEDKIKRGFDELINLWGPDHHGYIKRVKISIEALGYKKEILKIIIIQLVTLKTKERMSKRAGSFIRLSSLVEDVGKDTARFYYLMRKNSSHLEFDLDLAKEMSFNNPLYYIQYVCARIESIFKKLKVVSFDQKCSLFLSEKEEIELLRTLLRFSYCLDKAGHSLEPVFIIEFLKSLAANFHKFYEKIRVIDDDKNLTQARLNLLLAVKVVFHCGLGLLGITPVEKM